MLKSDIWPTAFCCMLVLVNDYTCKPAQHKYSKPHSAMLTTPSPQYITRPFITRPPAEWKQVLDGTGEPVTRVHITATILRPGEYGKAQTYVKETTSSQAGTWLTQLLQQQKPWVALLTL